VDLVQILQRGTVALRVVKNDPVSHHTCDAHVTSEESYQKESVQSKSPKTGSNRIFLKYIW
jgi:hypothetical protein